MAKSYTSELEKLKESASKSKSLKSSNKTNSTAAWKGATANKSTTKTNVASVAKRALGKDLKSSNKTSGTAAWKGAKISKPNSLTNEKVKAATTALKNRKKKSGSLKDY